MVQKRRGIVVKKNQGRSTFLMLDEHLGRLTVISGNSSLCTGAFVTYILNPLSKAYRIDAVELIYVPFALAQHDILFLHHTLELCGAVLQEGQQADTIINLFSALYSVTLPKSSFFKKLFVSKLCVALGLYPEERQLESISFDNLSVESLDSMLSEPINLEFEKKLDEWLFYCMAAYPHARYLKTLHFLTRNRVV